MVGMGAFLLALSAVPALAQTPNPAGLRGAERDQALRAREADAATVAAEAAAARERHLAEVRVAAAARAQAAEAAEEAAYQRAERASAAAQVAVATAAAREADLAPLIPVLRRLALLPDASLLAAPGAPEDTLRGLIVLRALAREAEAAAGAARRADATARQEATAALDAAEALAAARNAARSAAAAVDRELAAARARRSAADTAEEAAARRATEAAARATDLREAIARLDRERAEEEAREALASRRAAAERLAAGARARAEAETRRAARQPEPPPAAAVARRSDPEARGTDVLVAGAGRAAPVAGRTLRGFGDPAPGGPSRGLTLAANPGARVVSPCAGRTVFAAPFRSYGLLLIVDCGGGTHVVLAGLDRLDAAPGARLLVGEPVGVLGGAGDGARPTLYVELRRNGQPVDPAPWFGRGG